MHSTSSATAPVLRRLGALPVADFMRRFWQRKPLVIRQALPGLVAPLSAAQLRAAAARADVQSRLVTAFAGHWQLQRGPFAARALPARTRPGWTLLVQATDALDGAAAQLLARFRFVPDARVDDLMISVASRGGGVGPHLDSYDVFLVQAQGRRRWRISRQRDVALRPGLPLAILAQFRPQHEWVLEPGDVLYLPPGVAHEGVALDDDCITCSVGLRAPRWAEAIDPWLDTLGAHPALQRQYRDAGQAATARPARLPAAMIDALHAALKRAAPTRADAARSLLVAQSEPRPEVVFAPPARALGAAAFMRAARRHGVQLDQRSRVLYAGAMLAVNGELQALPTGARRLLQRLADQRALAPAACPAATSAAAALLHDWYRAGWLHLAHDPT